MRGASPFARTTLTGSQRPLGEAVGLSQTGSPTRTESRAVAVAAGAERSASPPGPAARRMKLPGTNRQRPVSVEAGLVILSDAPDRRIATLQRVPSSVVVKSSDGPSCSMSSTAPVTVGV